VTLIFLKSFSLYDVVAKCNKLSMIQISDAILYTIFTLEDSNDVEFFILTFP
jgi:hypothetical protein